MSIESLRSTIKRCTKCAIHSNGTPVLGDGPDSQGGLLIVGEALGATEVQMQMPFVGISGKLLTDILSDAGLSRGKDYFITNIVKCRPTHPGFGSNRTPNTEEINNCFPYFSFTVDILRPKYILCVGTVAARAVISKDFKIMSSCGNLIEVKIKLPDGDRHSAVAMAVLHPAYIIRQSTDDRLNLVLQTKSQLFKLVDVMQMDIKKNEKNK